MPNRIWTSEDIISDTLKTGPDVQLATETKGYAGRLVRWRQFMSSYSLPPLPTPVFVVHLGGKRSVHYREGNEWSERSSIPGTVSIVPAGVETEWLINGELDVATLSIGNESRTLESLPQNLSQFVFSFSDPLSVALTRQIMAELYQPKDTYRDDYLRSMLDTLQSHILRDRASVSVQTFPGQSGDMSRMQGIINDLHADPARVVRTEELAELASMSPAQFCRTFKVITGETPKRYALKIKIERAKELLSHSNLSVGEISVNLGFSNQSHLTRVFRDVVGVPPLEYRLACARTNQKNA